MERDRDSTGSIILVSDFGDREPRFMEAIDKRDFLRRIAIGLFGLAAVLLAAFAPTRASQAQTIQHGPFEIVASPRRVSSGTFPNIGGNPFATVEVTSFALRWRGRSVQVPGRGDRFWQALRLVGAPQPAILLVERDFTLISEQNGELRVQLLNSQSSSLAEAQWLDSKAGQPGEPQSWGISKVDLATQTVLQGGRFLLLGSALVLDVNSLQLHKIEPWVPMVPGKPVTELSRDGDLARAFSPGRTQYVLAGSQSDYARGHGEIYGLLVVDMIRGTAYELRADRRRMPFADTQDMDLRWIDHYFVWQRDAGGQERLVPRVGAQALPWRGRLTAPSHGTIEYHVERVQPALLEHLRRVVLALPGAALAPDWIDPRRGIDGNTVRVGPCLLGLSAREAGMPEEKFSRVGVYITKDEPATREQCNETVRRIAVAMDVELATGRHNRLIVLD